MTREGLTREEGIYGMDRPKQPHYLLIPVVWVDSGDGIHGHYKIRAVNQGLSALRVDGQAHPRLYSQLTQFRRLDPGAVLPPVGVMTGELSGGAGTVTLHYLSPPYGHKQEPQNTLFYVTDNKNTTYIVRLVDASRGQWVSMGQKGDVRRVFASQTEAHRHKTPAPVVVLSEEEEEERATERERRHQRRQAEAARQEVIEVEEEVEEALGELPPSLAPEFNLPLEAVDIFARLEPIPPTTAKNEAEFTMQTVNYLIGNMSAMTLDVDKTERVTWAVFMLHHSLRIHLDKELGHSKDERSLREWPVRFAMYRRMYEHGATLLLNSQGMYGLYDVPSFAENQHDELHPIALQRRAHGVFSGDKVARAIASRAAGVRTAADQSDVLTALFLWFCRRHAHNIYFARMPASNAYQPDFLAFCRAIHEDDEHRAERALRDMLDDYEERLVHPLPNSVDLSHPLLLEDEETSAFRRMELDHQKTVLENEEAFDVDERARLAEEQRKRDRLTHEAQKEDDAETPRHRKIPGRTPQGSPLEIDVRICAGIQRLAARMLGPIPKVEAKPPKVEVKAPKVEAKKPVVPTEDHALPTLASVKAQLAGNLKATPQPKAEPVCSVCKAPEVAGHCPVCKTAYCGEICQAKDWDAAHMEKCGRE